MLDLQPLIESLPARPDPRALLAELVPPARFAGKSFEDYQPRHPTQERARQHLQALAEEMRARAGGGLAQRLRSFLSAPPRGGGVYLDGGFGVGKTHLLAALWNRAPLPKAYLSFDELVYCAPYMKDPGFRELFLDQRLVCIDEWELDDPGNLTLGLSILRDLIGAGVRVAATSNTLPLELGAGRFSQKDFELEIAELARAFEVVVVEGDDYRHRHFELAPGREYFVSEGALQERARAAGDRALLVGFRELLHGLAALHPLRYVDLVHEISGAFVRGVSRIDHLPDGLRFVHFIDRLYNSAVPLTASSAIGLGELFPEGFLTGPYGKKFSRCLSRLEEMLAESARE